MSFDLKIRLDTSEVRSNAQQAQSDIGKTGDAADQAAESMSKLGQAAGKAAQDVAYGMKAAAGTVGATGETFSDFFDKLDRDQQRVFQQIKGPWADYQADLRATSALFNEGRISMGEFEGASARLADRLDELQRRDLSPQLRLEIDLLEQIAAPLKRYEQELAALQSLLSADQISLEQYDASLAKVQKRAQAGGVIAPAQGPVFSHELAGLAGGAVQGLAFDPTQAGKGVSDELKREEDILRRLNGPMHEYENTVKALNSLLERGRIDLGTYNNQLDKATKARVSSIGGSAVGGEQGEHGEHGGRAIELIENVAPRFGAAGEALAGFASKGTIATAAAVALAMEVVHLGDEYIVLANKAQKVTEKGADINDTLETQFALSKKLHGSLDATIELYDSIRDGTDELNMSQAQQLQLTKEIGQAVLAEGKSLEAAGGLMNRLTFAFANGAVTGRDLRSIMKSFPDIGGAFVETLGHSRQELIAMANKGQISAEMIIDAFHKMNKEMSEKVDKQMETTGQKWQHLKDEVVLGAAAIGDKAATGIEVAAHAFKYFGEFALLPIVGQIKAVVAGIDAIGGDEGERRLAAFKRIGDQMRLQRETLKLIAGEEERNANTAEIAGAAKKAGVEFAPFDEAQANKISEIRVQQRQLGIETADAFEAAHGKAQMFGKKLEEIRERKDAEQIAEDVKRIYDVMHGADDLVDDQFKRWRGMATQIQVIATAIETRRAIRGTSAPETQEERDLALQKKNLESDQTVSEYGRKMVSYAQGINTARAELERLNAAHRAGIIVGDDFKKQYEGLMTTLNNGRLPETIKLWNDLRLPQQQFARDNAALDSLLHTGAITLYEYNTKLRELREALDKTGFVKILYEEHDAFVKQEADMERYLAGHRTMAQDRAVYQAKVAEGKRQDAFVEGVAEPARMYEQALRDIDVATKDWGFSESVALSLQLKAREAFDSSAESLEKLSNRAEGYASALQKLQARRDVGARDDGTLSITDEQFQHSVLVLDRAAKVVESYAEPLSTYNDKVEAINVAVTELGLTHEKAAVQLRKAQVEYRSAEEALAALKGPQEQYSVTLKHLDDQLAHAEISQSKYTDAVAKAKEQLLTDAGKDKTFFGGLELQFIKLQQEADKLGATVADQLVGDLGKFSDAIVQAANGGEVSWSGMADAMIQDLERVILKTLELKLISSAIGLFSGGGGGGGLADTSNAGGVDYGGFANGGSFVVGGDGGVDTTPIAFRATRGERVTISPPGAYPYASAGTPGRAVSAASAPAPIVHIHNHYDTSVAQAAMDGPGGQKSVLNTLRVNSGAARSMTSRPRRA